MIVPVDVANQQIISRVLNILARRAFALVRDRIPSETLRAALKVVLTDKQAVLFIPHYWAIYVHDGRGAVTPKDAVWLVWFADPQDDPRIRGGYPVRGSDVRRLTKAQWLDGLRRNQENELEGLDPYMIVRQYSGPARGTPFFEKLRLADQVSASLVRAILDQALRSLVPSETDTARLRL